MSFKKEPCYCNKTRITNRGSPTVIGLDSLISIAAMGTITVTMVNMVSMGTITVTMANMDPW